MNLRGIGIFLGLNYLLVFLLAFVFLSEGALAFQRPNLFQYLLQAAMMGIPALCAVIARHFSPDELGDLPPIWPIPGVAAARVTVLAPVLFAITCGLATLLGFTTPQWNLAGLLNRVGEHMSAPLPPEAAAIAPGVTLVFYPIISILVGATLFAFIALGSEIGWRSYLMPRLLPLGKIPACLIGGLCWGLWFLPFIYGWYRETGEAGMGGTMLRTIALAIALGAVLTQIVQRTRNLGIAALALGAFAGQASGIWDHLFQQQTPPWTGTAGLISIAVWCLAACIPWLYAPNIGTDAVKN